MAAMGMIGGLVNAGMTMMAAGAQASAMEAKGKAERAQLEHQAKLTRASGSREQEDVRRENEEVISTFRARAAKSGLLPKSPSTEKAFADLTGEALRRETLKGQVSEEEAENLRFGGRIREFNAQQDAKAARAGGFASAVGGLFKSFSGFARFSSPYSLGPPSNTSRYS